MRRRLDDALRLAERGSHAAALAGGLLMLAAAILVSIDVVLRKLANVTLGGADELSGYALAIGSTWSFAFVLLNRGNVRIDVLYQYLPRPLAAACDLLALLALLGFVTLVAWHGGGMLAQTWRIGARSNSALGVPLAIPQAMWWLGYAWFVLCGTALVVRAALSFAAADWVAVNRSIGARGIREEADEEVHNALQSTPGRRA